MHLLDKRYINKYWLQISLGFFVATVSFFTVFLYLYDNNTFIHSELKDKSFTISSLDSFDEVDSFSYDGIDTDLSVTPPLAVLYAHTEIAYTNLHNLISYNPALVHVLWQYTSTSL